MTPPPAPLRVFPPGGPTPVAWQSQFHGVRRLATSLTNRFSGIDMTQRIDHLINGKAVAAKAPAKKAAPRKAAVRKTPARKAAA